MFIKLSSLSEEFEADLALIGFKARVSPEVIQHVALLREFLPARGLSTNQDRIEPLSDTIEHLPSVIDLAVMK